MTHNHHYHNLICTTCYAERVPPARARLQAKSNPPQRPTCMTCGEAEAQKRISQYTVAPMHKSNYMLFTNPADLIGINNKGGLVK
jgi:RNase P subunit RPR2